MAAIGPGARYHPPLRRALQHQHKTPVLYNPTKPETFEDWWLTAQARFSDTSLLKTVLDGRPTSEEVSEVIADYEYKRRRQGGVSNRRKRRIINDLYEKYEQDARRSLRHARPARSHRGHIHT